MKLPWRDVWLDEQVFSTSITTAEAQKLEDLARGRSVIEIGTAYGYSACLMGRVARSVMTVDPHNGHGSMPASLPRARSAIRALRMEYNVALVIANSRALLPKLINAGAKFELVFVDGDHRFASVKTDLLHAEALLNAGGVLAVHDYGEDTCPDVRTAVDSLYGEADHVLTDTLFTIQMP